MIYIKKPENMIKCDNICCHKTNKVFIVYNKTIYIGGRNTMNTLLLFFALPIATIILAIALQKILKCPFLVAGVFFAIYLIVAFAAFDASFLVFAVVYTIIAFLTAIITQIICNLINRLNNNDGQNCGCQNNLNTQNTTQAVSNCNCCNQRRCR